ncbi:MAG TPA: aldo/keto reductase [Solirubrobacteraceae bacterium]
MRMRLPRASTTSAHRRRTTTSRSAGRTRWTPLLSGAYVRPGVALDRAYLTADNERRLAAARRVAEDSDLTVNQLVLAWLRQAPAARVVPIVAASSTEQLDESLDALSVELTAQQLTALDEAPTVYGTWSTTS